MYGQLPQKAGAAGGVAFGQAGRTQARSPAQSIDLQPGVVGQRPQAGCSGIGQRLGDGIGGVVGAFLGDRELDPNLAQIRQVHSTPAE
jgi:hypothetical protein